MQTRLLVFRQEVSLDHAGLVWLYKGDLHPDQNPTTTWGELRPTDKVGYDFPDEDNPNLDGYETAWEAGLC